MSTTKAILTKLYPLVSKALETNEKKYKACIGRFMEARSKYLYDICPCDRIVFGQSDIDDFYNSMGFTQSQVTEILKQTYYWDLPAFKKIAKDEFTITMLAVIRYYYMKNDDKNRELSTIYLSFSGKLYPSIHYGKFPVVQPSEYRHVMEYVVNNMLSGKFDIKREKTVFGAIRSIGNTWFNSYKSKFKTFTDEDVVYVIQQLHNRIKSFMGNVAEKYYEAYEKKDMYISYDSDSMDQDDFRLADNDSLLAERCVEKAMGHLNNTVDYRLCKMAANSNVKVDEVKSIIESILSDPKNINICKELFRIIICTYFTDSSNKDIKDIKFVTSTITPKPNSKDKNYIRQKQIIETWLEEGSPAYRKRKSREATRISYNKALLTYFTLLVYEANK